MIAKKRKEAEEGEKQERKQAGWEQDERVDMKSKHNAAMVSTHQKCLS